MSIEGVQPESSGYNFADHKDSPSQGRSEVASQSNDGTENPSVTRFNGNAALSPVSKARTAADGSRGSKSNPEKNDIRHEVGVGKVGFQMSKSSLESGESCKTGNKARADSGHVELNGGYRLRRSSRKRQSICYNENLYHEGDSVCPPKRLRDSHMSSSTKKEHQNAAVTDGVFTRDMPTDSAAAAAVDRYKKEPKQKASASQEERFCSKNCKTGEFELEVKKAVIPMQQ